MSDCRFIFLMMTTVHGWVKSTFEPSMEICVGYCGKVDLGNGNYSSCQACPWGYRRSSQFGSSQCVACKLPLTEYDWLYLGFIAVIPLLLHSFFIEYYAGRKSTRKLLALEHLSSCIECIVGAFLSILLIEPIGLFKISGCGVETLSDWYTMFFNPVVNFSYTLRCTHEAVYPLYSLPFLYYGFCLLSLAICRTSLLCAVKTGGTGASSAVYAALYFYPALSIAHAIFAGLIYYSFPYILLLTALITNALHFALYDEQSIISLFKEAASVKNLCTIITHCFLFGYCILSFSYSTVNNKHLIAWCALVIVPLPALFYILTVGLTKPKKDV